METATISPVDHISLYLYICSQICVSIICKSYILYINMCVRVCIGVSSLLTREVVEWMGMGVATMPVIKMNRYAKSACRCTCIYRPVYECTCFLFVCFLAIVRMGMLFNKINVNGYILAVHDIVDYKSTVQMNR